MPEIDEVRQANAELAKVIDEISRSPYGEILSAWRRFTAAAHADGELRRKHKELIAIALSISKGCERCIAYHVKAALEAGASPGEIMEAAFVAVIMDGGPALAHMSWVLRAIEAYHEKTSHR